MEDWLASVPEWLKAAVSVLGTIGGIALTYALSRLGMGHGKEKAKEEAAAQTAPPSPALGHMPANLVGIGGALLERSQSEAMMNVVAGLSLSLDKHRETIERLSIMFGKWLDHIEDADEREKIKAEIGREAELRALVDELARLRKDRHERGED